MTVILMNTKQCLVMLNNITKHWKFILMNTVQGRDILMSIEQRRVILMNTDQGKITKVVQGSGDHSIKYRAVKGDTNEYRAGATHYKV